MFEIFELKEFKLLKNKRFFFACLASFLAGFLASMIGVGGGILKVPIMNLIFQVPIKVAIGTSEFMILITSSVATLIYHFQAMGNSYYEVIGIVGGLVGAQLGSRISLRVNF